MSLPNFFSARHANRLSRLLLLAAALGVTAHSEVKVGDVFPSLADAGLVGRVPTTEGRVVLVDFWASWCAPCKDSFSTYGRLHADYSSRGLVLVAVSVDHNPDAFAAFVRKLEPAFPVLRDQSQQLVRRVMVPAMPTCFLLGRDGRVRFVHRGFHGTETDREIRKEADLLLAEKSNPS